MMMLMTVTCVVGFNPSWDDELTLKIHVAELAVVNFTVYTKDAFVAQYSLPFTSILQGTCVCLSYCVSISRCGCKINRVNTRVVFG